MFQEATQPQPGNETEVRLSDELAHADAHAYLDPFHPNYGAEMLRDAAMRDQAIGCPLRRALYTSGAKWTRSWFTTRPE